MTAPAISQPTSTPPALPSIALALRDATLAARRRMGDDTIAVTVKRGDHIVVCVHYRTDGTSHVRHLSDPGTASDAVAFLNNL
jgi:hypothetical protein